LRSVKTETALILVMLGVVHVLELGVLLALRRRPDEVDNASDGQARQIAHVALHELVAAIVGLRLEVDAGHVEASLLQALGGSAGAAVEIESTKGYLQLLALVEL
jgi:hypothetical protein